MSKKPKRTYTREFQENAVKLAIRGRKSVAGVAADLGMPPWKLRQWLKEAEEKAERSSNIDDLLALRRENQELKEELEILKKAAAYFAKELK